MDTQLTMDDNKAMASESRGFYKLSWTQRIGFGSGDLAQNLIYQTISMYLLFFYTNVYGLEPAVAAIMFLIVRIVDVIWDPLVGTFVDKHNPSLGKYRAYLVLGGIPLTGFAILCFWNGFSGSLLYAYITYVGLSMCYTLVNVPYGALNASLTRDTNEITILTSVRMFMANVGGLAVGMGIPIILKIFDPTETTDLSSSDSAWFITMAIYGVIGLALLIFCFSQCRERVVMDKSETENVKVSDLWLEFVRNKPLRILAFFFITAFGLMAISNSAGAYYINYNLHGSADELSIFMGLGSIPAFIFMPMIPKIKRMVGKKGMFYIFLMTAIVGMGLLYMISMIDALKEHMWLVYVAQFIKSTLYNCCHPIICGRLYRRSYLTVSTPMENVFRASLTRLPVSSIRRVWLLAVLSPVLCCSLYISTWRSLRQTPLRSRVFFGLLPLFRQSCSYLRCLSSRNMNLTMTVSTASMPRSNAVISSNRNY